MTMLRCEDIRKLIVKRLQVPVVFKGMIESWKCRSWLAEDWIEACQDLKFNFRVALKGEPRWERDADYIRCSLQEFYDWVNETACKESLLASYNPSTHWCYSSYNYMSKVFESIPHILQVVDWKTFGFENRQGKESTFWVGSSGAHTPCHQDTYGCNLVAQVCGRKRWVLFPPEDVANLYPTRIPYEESSIFSEVNITCPDLSKHSKFRNAHPHVITLQPGEVLFVPKLWWHFVECLEPSISVNTWIELPSDEESRLNEAIVRTLMTALVPVYQPDGMKWINPTEELVSSEETVHYIHVVLNNLCNQREKNAFTCDMMQQVGSDGRCGKKRKLLETGATSSYEDVTSECAWMTEVPSLSFTEFQKMFFGNGKERNSLEGISCSSSKTEVPLKDVINCFVHPDVIQCVVDKLTNLFICTSSETSKV
ncbi:HSPB1 associated protein 1 isoform X1 [Tachypleus tridentatus]|uniref:HSPB1 associated protein 1 isoform X1 n=1 Tax=Tachypleus tridentatus TaxID=6853 RepID=UPI003FD0E079